MNYELLKDKMEKFFKETSVDKLVEMYELLGYNFIDSKPGNKITICNQQ